MAHRPTVPPRSHPKDSNWMVRPPSEMGSDCIVILYNIDSNESNGIHANSKSILFSPFVTPSPFLTQSWTGRDQTSQVIIMFLTYLLIYYYCY